MARPVRKSTKTMQRSCDRFNERFAPGDVIKCWPAGRLGVPVERTIKAPGAMILSGHTPVVYCTEGGCIALSHVQWSA